MKHVKQEMEALLERMENNLVMTAIRRGMVLSMPVLLLAALANAFLNLPINAYQRFLLSFAGGGLSSILNFIITATQSVLSLIMLFTISYSYAEEVGYKYKIIYPLCAFSSFLAFSAEAGAAFNPDVFGVTWMFTAIVVTLISCGLLHVIFQKGEKLLQKMYAEGVDSYYQTAMNAILPVGVITVLFAVLNFGIAALGGDSNIQNVGMLFCRKLFEHVGTGLGGGILYVFLIHLLWYFGIHGDNVLAMVMFIYFMPASTVNQTMVSMGLAPTEIYSHPFFNYFVLMGGTGATLCLLLAIFIVSRKANNRRLAGISIFPAIFNINEPILWGFPVILNPIMFIPFLAAPMASMLFSVLMMKLGIVPVAVYDVGWTLPVLFSGVKSTGSIMGAVLQVCNILIGTAIYIPFVRIYERIQTNRLKDNIDRLKEKVSEGEESEIPVTLLNGGDRLSSVASMMVEDMHYAMKQGDIQLYYQPQIRNDGSLLGAEALLRWKHPVLEDYVYPPLVIQLAKEDGFLDELGIYIIEEAAKALERFAKQSREPLKISVNVSAAQLENPHFCDEVIGIINKYDFGDGKLAIEITEQISLSASPVVTKRIETLHKAGIEFIMDDFGMGHSSLMYLKTNQFSYVKLDGSMVRELLQNDRVGDIIISIKQLSRSLGFDIIAEYVEVPRQRERLEELGCNIYQGWLYSKAIASSEFEEFMEKHQPVNH